MSFTLTLPLQEALQERFLQQHYARTAEVPAFTTSQVCPVQNLWVEHRLSQGQPVPLATHSHPSRFWSRLPAAALQLYRLFYLHQEIAPENDWNTWLEGGLLSETSSQRLRANWQITAVASPAGPRLLLSSIQGRSPGEFVYLGDDSGLLIEAAWKWLRGRARGRAADLCCGCGVVGLSLPPGFEEIVGLDFNATAIQLARLNQALNPVASTRFEVSDMWEASQGQFDFVIGNPPALPLTGEGRSLLYAYGGENPAQLTLKAVAGLSSKLAPGGRCLLLSFSVREQLWEQLLEIVPPEFSLSYRPRKRLYFRDSQLGWMEHVWIQIVRDARGRRQKLTMSWWDRARSWALPGLRAEANPQECYAGNVSK